MEALQKFLLEITTDIVNVVWGPYLVIFLVGCGIILFFISFFSPLRHFGHALKLVSGRFHYKDQSTAPGQLTHFQALMNALAATVGLGNISGVAVAIYQGGAGAIFWMWCIAFLGMNTKFFECTLSVMFRGKNYKGEVDGGPMYVIKENLSKKWHFLAYLFSGFGMIGTLTIFQSNQLAEYLEQNYLQSAMGDYSRPFVGGVVAVFVFIVLSGGLKRITKVTSSLVPFMCVFYVLACLAILFLNMEKIPSLFVMIFQQAFQGDAVTGGFLGALIIGVKRATFSNEAGLGTAPMAHSNVKTNEPIGEGLVAMLGPVLDTIIICTMTALVILCYVDGSAGGSLNGVLLTGKAFSEAFPVFGSHFLAVAVLVFSLTTMVGYSNYGEKCFHFLFKGRGIFKTRFYTIFYSLALFVGAFLSLDIVVNILDIGLALMSIPNLIITLILAPQVVKALKVYEKKYLK